jgi:hypothetical protein
MKPQKFNYFYLRPKIKTLSQEGIKRWYCENIDSNTTAKAAFFMSKDLENSFFSQCKKTSLHKIIPELFHTVPIVVELQKECILYELLNDVMRQAIAAGIPQHFWKNEQEVMFNVRPKLRITEDNRRILSLYDLEYGFVVWLIACGISTAVFVVEFVGPKLMKVRDSVGIIYFIRLLKTRLAQFYS